MTLARRNPYDLARLMGRRAAERGRSIRENPYDGKAYRAAWLDGYREQQQLERALRAIESVADRLIEVAP